MGHQNSFSSTDKGVELFLSCIEWVLNKKEKSGGRVEEDHACSGWIDMSVLRHNID
jgi:hypothetical protein